MVFAYERAQNFKNVVNFLRFFLEKFSRTWGKVQSEENSRARSGYLKNSLKDSNQWNAFYFSSFWF